VTCFEKELKALREQVAEQYDPIVVKNFGSALNKVESDYEIVMEDIGDLFVKGFMTHTVYQDTLRNITGAYIKLLNYIRERLECWK
jgi:hypothetical protein